MKFKKLLSLCIAMAAISLAACNGQSSEAPASSQEAPATSQVAPKSSEAPKSTAQSSAAPKSSAASSSKAASSAAPSSSKAASSVAPVEGVIELPWTNAESQGFCDSTGKTKKGGYATWNLTDVKAGNYEFRAYAKQGSGADSKTLATRCYKFVINGGAEIDPTNNDKIPTEMGVTSPDNFTEGVFSVLTLPAGAVEFKFGTTSASDYRLTFDLSKPAQLVPVAA